jgi:hypothetical protein
MVRHGRGFPMQPIIRPQTPPPAQRPTVYVIAQLGKDDQPTCYLMDLKIRHGDNAEEIILITDIALAKEFPSEAEAQNEADEINERRNLNLRAWRKE